MKKVQGYALVCLLFLTYKLSAQSGIGTASFTNSVLTENFDGFASTSCPCNSMPNGWYVYDGVDNKWSTGTGTSAAGDLYLYGLASPSTNRALGGLRTAIAAPLWGVKITNNTPNTITSLRVRYTGEAWRVVNRGSADTLNFQYNIGGSTLIDATGWKDVDALDFRTIPLATGATTITGAANSALNIDYTITGIDIPVGTTVFFRWVDSDVAGSDDGTAIDDVTITANPACGSGTTYLSQDFEAPLPTGACWSTNGMAISGKDAIFNTASGRTTTTTLVSGTTADQLKGDLINTGLYSTLKSTLPSTLTWEFTVRTDTGLGISTSNLWGYFLYTDQSNLISTVSNTGYAVGVNLGSTSDKTIKLYKLNAQRWDAAAITTLITSGYNYPASAATQIDRNVTVKVVRTGTNQSATWALYINNVSQGTVTDASPALPAAVTYFTSGFFNIHSAGKFFEIDDILLYERERPCNTSNSICGNGALILPLQLTYFKGAIAGNITQLNWQVSNQKNTRTFDVERSQDGLVFEKIGTVPVSNSQSLYQFQAAQKFSSAYYRLKMTDYNGVISHSAVVQISAINITKAKLLISSNPVSDDTKILFSKSETGILQILNNTGQVVSQQKISNQQQARLNTQALAKGNYMITFSSTSGTTSTNRFVKL